MTRFASAFISSIDGTSSEISTKDLCGGARIYYIFNSVFGNSLELIDPTTNLSVLDIRTAIRNSTGPRPSLFVPELAFDLLVKPQIRLLEVPSHRCVELVYEELIKIAHTCGSQELLRYPRLQAKLIETVSDLLRERLGPTSTYVESLIAIQRAYINTNHPNFLGAAAAMSSVISNKQEKERKAQALERRKERTTATDRRRPNAPNPEGGQPAVNGTDPPEFDEIPSNNTTSELVRHFRVNSRSMSPAPGHLQSSAVSGAINGRPNSPQVFTSPTQQQNKATDSFLNYFFGKEGGMPASSGATPKSVAEPSFSQSIRRGQERLEREKFNVQDVQRMSRDFEETSLVCSPMGVTVEGPVLSFSFFVQEPPGLQSNEPALTEREQMETELIQRLISSYFNIVRETIQDQVPKAVMHFLVNHSKDAIQNRLVTELYREDFFGDLLYEDDAIKAERVKCERLLKTYREAAKIISEVGL